MLTPALKLAVDGGPAQKLTPPLTLTPAHGSLLELGRRYRGQLVIDVLNGKLRAINVLPLEQYLYGVVPAEMPSAWLPDALEAQAVAARSYALASRQGAAPFDVYADGRSQAYLGASVETPAGNAAVDQTAAEILLYNGNVADTLFSSSTGGRTQSAADAFGAPGRPYLVSVRDPYDTISPYHDWGPVPVTAKMLQNAFGAAGHVVDATVGRNPSKRVKTVKLTSLQRGTQRTSSVRGAALGVGVRSSLDVVQHRCPLAAGAGPESGRRSRHEGHAERCRARRPRRRRAGSNQRRGVEAAPLGRPCGDGRRLPFRRSSRR